MNKQNPTLERTHTTEQLNKLREAYLTTEENALLNQIKRIE